VPLAFQGTQARAPVPQVSRYSVAGLKGSDPACVGLNHFAAGTPHPAIEESLQLGHWALEE
jgi:hypothetical protein